MRVTPEMHAQIAELARLRNEQAERDGDLRVWSLSDVVRDILARHLRDVDAAELRKPAAR